MVDVLKSAGIHEASQFERERESGRDVCCAAFDHCWSGCSALRCSRSSVSLFHESSKCMFNYRDVRTKQRSGKVKRVTMYEGVMGDVKG